MRLRTLCPSQQIDERKTRRLSKNLGINLYRSAIGAVQSKINGNQIDRIGIMVDGHFHRRGVRVIETVILIVGMLMVIVVRVAVSVIVGFMARIVMRGITHMHVRSPITSRRVRSRLVRVSK
jgi:hypothetical protein